jgi:hypothetical protein
MMPVTAVQTFLERLAGEHPYIFYFIAFCAAYEVDRCSEISALPRTSLRRFCTTDNRARRIPCRFQLYHLTHLLEDILSRFPRADVRQASAATLMARP